jgi:hypothetical protein
MSGPTAAGVELLGREWDARANAYLPLSGDKTRSVSTANGQSSDPYLAGSGIFYDTGGQTVATLTEEPQPGFDLELGVRVPAFADHVEAIRVYGGGYHFIGDKTEDVSGWRARVVADVTPSFSIGGRFQRDDERGSQGFLEATLRFPFEAKKSFREEGLRARLDESPERDVDIVTGAKVTRRETYGQKGVAVLASATGDAQRVLHVDNMAGAGGDGSKDRPFNTLKAAEAAMQAHDVIYVHAGDGTTTGQDEGIVIDAAGVSLIGAGTNFVYDGAKFTAGSRDYTGTLLAAATTAPVITNEEIDGDGIKIISNYVNISGLWINGASGYGILVKSDGINQYLNNIKLYQNYSSNNGRSGISVESLNGGYIGNVSIEGNYSYSNTLGGNGAIGILIMARGGGTTENVNVIGNHSYNNHISGIYVYADSGNIDGVNIYENESYENTNNGFITSSNNGGILSNLAMINNVSKDNYLYGYRLSSNAMNSSNLEISVSGMQIFGNGRDGIFINDDTAGIFIVDLGAGSLGSAGNNSIYGNGTEDPASYRDMRLDLDNGSISAQGNWWGQAGGPAAGQIVSEGACPGSCGTADTSNPLDHDPNL